MEEFISEIYRECDTIEYLKEYISLTNSGCFRDARSIYDKAAGKLETMLIMLSEENSYTASHIQNIALQIKDSFNDFSLAKGLAEGSLLPELYSYISRYTGIDVTEGRYTLKSSKTGYLTVKDTDLDLYYHSTYDPMWEARETAKSLLTPDMQTILIFGCGLGYLPYQLWYQSEGALDIVIYEEDTEILQYAYDYGVMSLIPETDITIVNHTSKNILADKFIQDVRGLSSGSSFVFSYWKKSLYKEIDNSELKRMIINRDLKLEMTYRSAANLSRNLNSPAVTFDEIAKEYGFEEWVVISAGPSFDDRVSFLKESKGKRGLIAVNTVLKRLIKEDLIPDICVAADQYVQMIDHISGIEKNTEYIPLIADWVTNWKYIQSYRGKKCFVRTNASADLTSDIFPNETVWNISGTVACMAVEAAAHLGAKIIYLVGQDLAYPGGQRYAKDMPHENVTDKGYDLTVPSVDGGTVGTCEAFDWFRKALEHQISRYDNICFINMSKHGAYINGAQNEI